MAIGLSHLRVSISKWLLRDHSRHYRPQLLDDQEISKAQRPIAYGSHGPMTRSNVSFKPQGYKYIFFVAATAAEFLHSHPPKHPGSIAEGGHA